jgi:SET and MYND domain-containing protein
MMSECFETIKSIMGVEFLSNFSIKQLISYFGKMKINALSISNEDLSSCIGTGLYLSASSLNHSCYPNSVVIFNGTRLIVRSIADIKKNEEVYLF